MPKAGVVEPSLSYRACLPACPPAFLPSFLLPSLGTLFCTGGTCNLQPLAVPPHLPSFPFPSKQGPFTSSPCLFGHLQGSQPEPWERGGANKHNTTRHTTSFYLHTNTPHSTHHTAHTTRLTPHGLLLVSHPLVAFAFPFPSYPPLLPLPPYLPTLSILTSTLLPCIALPFPIGNLNPQFPTLPIHLRVTFFFPPPPPPPPPPLSFVTRHIYRGWTAHSPTISRQTLIPHRHLTCKHPSSHPSLPGPFFFSSALCSSTALVALPSIDWRFVFPPTVRHLHERTLRGSPSPRRP
jgi:hypothetical protein